MCAYKILLEEVQAEIVEKKSRFIAYLRPVNSEEEAQCFIDEIKKKHWDARHNCSAFVIGENNEMTRCSDDGEPSGTAGRPMLEVLTKESLHNVAVVVTRYFGGVLLGTGGLVRAYQGAVKEAINKAQEEASLGRLLKGKAYTLELEYNEYNKVNSYLLGNEIKIDNSLFEENVKLEITVTVDKIEKTLGDLTEITLGKLNIAEIGDREFVG